MFQLKDIFFNAMLVILLKPIILRVQEGVLPQKIFSYSQRCLAQPKACAMFWSRNNDCHDSLDHLCITNIWPLHNFRGEWHLRIPTVIVIYVTTTPFCKHYFKGCTIIEIVTKH